MNQDKLQNILLVDDKPENIMVLENILEGKDRRFLKANSGDEALHILLKQDVSLILLDVQMPGINGFETAKLIRGKQKTRHIPIIFVTAISKEQKHINEGYASGAVDYLFKPVDPDIVRSKVDIFLEMDYQKYTLQMQNRELKIAKMYTDSIFSNVEEGIFLLDKSYYIQPQYSQVLESILNEDSLGRKDLFKILDNHIDTKKMHGCRRYIKLMYQDEIDEGMLNELNPFAKIKYQTNYRDKYLSFKFKRVYDEEQIESLIVTVNDNTEQVELERKLQSSEEKASRQLELLNIIEVEPLLLKEFLNKTSKEIVKIKKCMDTIKAQKNIQVSAEEIFRTIHLIKGNAGILGLNFISEQAHHFEDILETVKDDINNLPQKSDLLEPILEQMRGILGEIYGLIAKMTKFYDYFNKKSGREGELVIKAMQDLIERLGSEARRKVKLDFSKFDLNSLPASKIFLIKDILVQLTRNSMTHGLGTEKDWIRYKKKETPTIFLSSAVERNNNSIIFRDNGIGMQLQKIRDKAVSSGKVAGEEILKWSKEKVIDLIFEQGFSTAERAGIISGRGVGMDIVKKKIEEVHGTITVDSEEGKFSQFTINIPVNGR